MDQPLLSIIVPIYNAEKFIRQTINSCIEQTNKNFELILINDGSTDNTLEILSEYADKFENIHVFTQKNQGVAAARNFGIQQSKGEWISFLDADDSLEKEFVERTQSIIRNKPAICGIAFGHNTQNENIQTPVSNTESEGLTKLNAFDLTEQFPTVWAKVFKASIIKEQKIKFYPAITLEDVFFALEYFNNCSAVYISKETIYNYQFNENSLSRKISLNTINSREEIVTAFYNKLLPAKNNPSFANFFLTRILKQVFLSTGKTMKDDEQKKAFLQSMNYCSKMLAQMQGDLSLSSKSELRKFIQSSKVKFAFILVIFLSKLPKSLSFQIMKLVGKL